MTAHTPTTFAADLSSGYWVSVSPVVDYYAQTGSWAVGDLITYNGQYWRCIVDQGGYLRTSANAPDGVFGYYFWVLAKTSTWSSAATYLLDDVVVDGGKPYYCIVAHTPTSFAADQASGYWSDEIVQPEDAPNHFQAGATALFAQEVSGGWSIKTTGNWRGDWAIQRSVDNGVNWSTIRTLSSRDDANYLVEEDEEGEDNLIRVQATEVLLACEQKVSQSPSRHSQHLHTEWLTVTTVTDCSERGGYG